jgi:hypothetical protein
MMAVLPVKRWIEGSYRFLDKKSDDFRWYHVEAKLVGNPDGEGLAYVHYTDVDDLKTAKESERERQTQYELAIKGAHLAVWGIRYRVKQADRTGGRKQLVCARALRL